MHTLAQARTSTLILRLDAEHNESVIRFLSSSGLAGYHSTSPRLLSGIALPDAKLSGANLRDANLRNANLSSANLTRTDLRVAYLSGADLSYARLDEANLRGADLREADLRRANLSMANLSETEGIANEELDQQAKSLKGATMPNGQKYEDWLKDKKAQGKDVKNE